MEEHRIQRVHTKEGNFSIILNEVFQRKDLSARAKGIWGYLMTLPDDWVVYRSEIFTHFSEGRRALDTAFNELIDKKYIKMERIRRANQFNGCRYTIYEHAYENTFVEIYLTPNKLKYTHNDFPRMKQLYTEYQNKEDIAQRIIEMPYEDFLQTQYWKIITAYMKNKAGDICKCGSNANLNTHHKTYEHHGYEIEYLDDLVVLCGDCHNKEHGI
jgi:hypothetical protein